MRSFRRSMYMVNGDFPEESGNWKAGRNMKTGKKTIWVILTGGILIVLLNLINSSKSLAYGSGDTDDNQFNEVRMEEKENQIVGNLEQMEYALFYETNIGYGVSNNYYRYDVYADFIETKQEGESIYYALNEKLLGKTLKLATWDVNVEKAGNLPREWVEHKKWAENGEEIIVDVSTDLKWMITREYETDCSGRYIERWYCDKKLVHEFKGVVSSDMKHFEQFQTLEGNYEAISEGTMEQIEEVVKKFYGQSFSEYYNKWICLDTKGKLLAMTENDENGCGVGINIYSIDEKGAVLLYRMRDLNFEDKWPMEISQIKGNEKAGWLVISYGDETYKMNYPSGDKEKIGEFMYGTVYSPDEKYLAYCTGNNFLFDYWEVFDTSLFWELRGRWDKVLPGWYIEECETGKTAYISMPIWKYDVDRPLYGGRCVWIEKDKLQTYLECMDLSYDLYG